MKAILFVPQSYSLAETLSDGFKSIGWSARIVDYQELLPHWYNRLYERTSGLPKRITKFWVKSYYKAINDSYMNLIESEKPDLLLIYNNQYFQPEILKKVKKKCRISFILGDNPLWSKTFDNNLEILKYSDCTISPDSHWEFELSSIGMPNIRCDYLGYSSNIFYPIKNIQSEYSEKYTSDILFIGRNYINSSGYKRALFLTSFAGMNFRLFGTKEWTKWLPAFPELKTHFTLLNSRISNEELNIALNCCKIYPVEQNSGIINGIHNRVFEVIGAGAIPIVEWRRDVDTVFGNLLPVVKDYRMASEIANHFLNDEVTRLASVKELRQRIENQYSPGLYIKRLIESIIY